MRPGGGRKQRDWQSSNADERKKRQEGRQHQQISRDEKVAENFNKRKGEKNMKVDLTETVPLASPPRRGVMM